MNLDTAKSNFALREDASSLGSPPLREKAATVPPFHPVIQKLRIGDAELAAHAAEAQVARADLSRLGAQPELWEKVLRKLHTGDMPPPNFRLAKGAPKQPAEYAARSYYSTGLMIFGEQSPST